MVKAVIFDMDGLMIDTERLLVKYWLEAAQVYGYEMKAEHVLGIRSMEAKHAARKLKQEIGQDFDYYKVRELRKKRMNAHIDTYGLEEKKGLGELLEYLKKHHYLTAVATATDYERTTRYLSSLDRFRYFDEIVCASMVEHGKPEPDIYLEAARQLKADPDKCLVFEDIVAGILAGKNAGMRVCAVEDAYSAQDADRKRKLADYYIHTYFHLF